MRSWVYYIQLRAYYQDGSIKEEGALYVFAVPLDEKLKEVGMECYAKEYIPQETVIKSAYAYAIGTDIPIEDKDLHYREDLDLYIFNEGVSFEEGLTKVYKILLEHLKKFGELRMVEPVVDVGTPSANVMYSCLKRALST